MPEYLAPGVYVEEVSFRSKSIEGVSTTTTGFIGPTRYGPLELEPELVTSLGEFERIYGDGQPLVYVNDKDEEFPPIHNFVWHAARAFFEEGGKRLYVVRTFRGPGDKDDPQPDFGFAHETIGTSNSTFTVRARFRGRAGDRRVRITANIGQNVLTRVPDPERPGEANTLKTVARGLRENDIVLFTDQGRPYNSPLDSPLSTPGESFRRVRAGRRPDTNKETWFFDGVGQVSSPLSPLDPLTLDLDDLKPDEGDQIQVVTLAVTVFPSDPSELPGVWTDLPLDPDHAETGTNKPDSIFDVFAAEPINRAMAYRLPIVVSAGRGLGDGLAVLELLNGESIKARDPKLDPNLINIGIFDALKQAEPTDAARSFDIVLAEGSDGLRPGLAEYEGEADPNKTHKTGFKALEDLEDISIVAAPGSTFGYDEDDTYRLEARAITSLLIGHAERMRYRIAVVDSGNNQSLSQVRAFKAQLDSKYAAFYYPWVRILDPITRREIHLPPSGFVAGIYARNDVERAVYKAPANEVVRLAIGFETLLNKSQQDVLNPEGINALRFFEGRGYRVWGARTTSSDPEWKYVNLRRYFAYLEHSIDRGTQWAVFEPNGELLWAGVRRTVEDFLLNEWQAGALLGDKPERAFFVRCDRSTMTQNDLDNGRLVCLVGVVALRPAEFVIFRIGQATADSMRRP